MVTKVKVEAKVETKKVKVKKCRCGKPVAEDRRLYCGQKCADAAQQEQLQQHGERRKQKTAVKQLQCAIPECRKEFKPTGPRSKYCCDECSAKGILMAIERQRQRREAEKQEAKRLEKVG